MRAIPIDVLRAFVAVVDQRGFTRAAEELGRTQPTVSLQVKRLEELIDTPLFEKSARSRLTSSGEICLEYGRKILAQHDEMLDLIERQRSSGYAIRMGMHSEIAAFLAPSLVKLAQRDGRGMNFEFTREISEILFDRLRTNQLDVALAVTAPGDPQDSLAKWNMPMSWIAAPGYTPPVNGPVPLITTPESSLYDKIAASALRKADRTFEIVCKGANDDVLKSAVDAGYGVCVRPSSWAPQGAHFVPASQIAALPDVTLGLFAPNGRSSEASRPLFARMINLLSASEALGGH